MFGGHVLLWGHRYPWFGLLVMSLLGFKAREGSLIHTWQRHSWCTFHEIHLWCATCHHLLTTTAATCYQFHRRTNFTCILCLQLWTHRVSSGMSNVSGSVKRQNLGMGLGPILKRHHRLALLTLPVTIDTPLDARCPYTLFLSLRSLYSWSLSLPVINNSTSLNDLIDSSFSEK